MKVLHIVGSLDKSAGGPSRSVPQTCIHLAKRGVQIVLVARPSANPVEISSTDNLSVEFKTMRQLFQYGMSISKKDFDIIHLQHVWDPYIHIMAFWAQVKGIPYVITPRGMLEPWIMNHNPWKKKLGMWLYQRKDLKMAKTIHATCEEEKKSVRNLGFKNPVHVIPNGIETNAGVAMKTDYGTKKIVFLSRIHIKKGLELLLDAWKKTETNGWQLEIAGEGEKDYVKHLQNKISEERISNVKFVGAMYGAEKWNFLKSGDICILPTYSENFGIVVAEALSVGVPVITTKGTPWQELQTENCGWWIELSVEQLEKTLADVIVTSSEELKKKGLNGMRLITERYRIESVAQGIIELYKGLK